MRPVFSSIAAECAVKTVLAAGSGPERPPPGRQTGKITGVTCRPGSGRRTPRNGGSGNHRRRPGRPPSPKRPHGPGDSLRHQLEDGCVATPIPSASRKFGAQGHPQGLRKLIRAAPGDDHQQAACGCRFASQPVRQPASHNPEKRKVAMEYSPVNAPAASTLVFK